MTDDWDRAVRAVRIKEGTASRRQMNEELDDILRRCPGHGEASAGDVRMLCYILKAVLDGGGGIR